MNVILLTVFLGLILVALALILFFYTSAISSGSSPEQDSLMPLGDENAEEPKERQDGPRTVESTRSAKL